MGVMVCLGRACCCNSSALSNHPRAAALPSCKRRDCEAVPAPSEAPFMGCNRPRKQTGWLCLRWLLAALAMAWCKASPRGLDSLLFRAIRSGNREAAREAARRGANVSAVDGRGFGVVSQALQGWQSATERFPGHRWNSTAHAEMITMLVESGLGDVRGGVLAASGCPVVEAVHFRLLGAAQQIARAMRDPKHLRRCFVSENAWGQTVLHAAATAHASGLTRLLLRLPLDLASSADAAASLGSLLDLDMAIASPRYRDLPNGVGGTLPVARFRDAVGASGRDVEWLLRAGEDAGADLLAWTAHRDNLGRTAAAIACAEGRLGTARALLDAGGSVQASEAVACQRLAQAAGFGSNIEVECEASDDGRCSGEGSDDLQQSGQATLASDEQLQLLLSQLEATQDVIAGAQNDARAPRKLDRGWSGIDRELAASVADVLRSHPQMLKAPPSARQNWTSAETLAAVEACVLNSTMPCLLRQPLESRSAATNSLWRSSHLSSAGQKRESKRLVRGKASAALHARPLVSLKQFTKAARSMSVAVADIPYGSTYGSQRASRKQLSAFVRETMGKNAIAGVNEKHAQPGPGHLPLYVFQALPPGRAEQIVPVPSLPERMRSHISQLIVGPAGTGAIPHYHGPAVNGLVVGRKLWVVTRPGCAEFSPEHARSWVLRAGWTSEAARSPSCIPWIFLQEAGDVMVVPRHFGHAVLNMQDTVAVAFEQP